VAEPAIRSAILAEHDEMRKLLGRVEALARDFERASEDDSGLGAQLHEHGVALYERFGAHLDHEQSLLEPVFARRGARGELMARRLAAEHHEQRELLRYLLKRLSSQPPTLLIARELQHFADFLRFEMREEEERLLTPEALGEGAD
jgi:hemerythrin-like domain-containing protein